MAGHETIEIAQDVRSTFASQALSAPQAKLYSQNLRLEMGQAGLASFVAGDVEEYLNEAILLLQCALLERDFDPESQWRNGAKRSAEILEWLSQASLIPEGAPLHLLAAAAYQVAEYPAMALGHLRQIPDDQKYSQILREFLRADFPAARQVVIEYWRTQRDLGIPNGFDTADLTGLTLQHVVMCIGTVCAYFRTGILGNADRAVAKLNKLAASFLHSRDPYSYLLARLTAASCRRFVETSVWPSVERLSRNANRATAEALSRYARSAFLNRRSLVWPAQADGIRRLSDDSSFVMCTPTGSGKTTIASLALVQAMFADQVDAANDQVFEGLGNLVLYLVPTRALAAEIEGRLTEDLSSISDDPIVITRLYGGTDWGPTDIWLATDRPTVLVCTFEKADALLRYLGVHILNRVRLIVIDEAHMAEQDEAWIASLEDGSSRAFRLEQLAARLFGAREQLGFRMIALSAVAASAAPSLARWISGSADASPTISTYRSTRQMLGRMEVSAAGHFSIRYDLMDGRPLRFLEEEREDSPFVPRPFPPIYGGVDQAAGQEVRMRGPTLWAALHLAAERPDGARPSVLISITQWIDTFASTCAELIEAWPEEALPNYWATEELGDEWDRCLASAADYFSVDSVEYRLLKRGIAVHHGKMPGQLARRLKSLIDLGHVRVVIATSTLSEGVNIPVNYLLIPNIYRGRNALSLQEFTNLVGRVGRPGVATEGIALVVLPETGTAIGRAGRQWDGYRRLVRRIADATAADLRQEPQDQASSSLAILLREIHIAWIELTGSANLQEFEGWLEQTAIIGTEEVDSKAHSYLDSLDGFLIAAIHELEEMRNQELTGPQLEQELARIWRRTYAFAAGRDEARLAQFWLARGRAIKTLYPEPDRRRSIYRSSLSPRSATILLDLLDEVRDKLAEGSQYVTWSTDDRLAFIREIIALLSRVPSFEISTRLGRRRSFEDWPTLLRWWMAKSSLEVQPPPEQITNWYDFVAKNFIYRATWGLGAILGLMLDVDREGEQIRPLQIQDWPRSGLPWIAFWLKELITWGTLDPAAAFVLARADATDRQSAEADAMDYFRGLPRTIDPDDALDPRRIREWASNRYELDDEQAISADVIIESELARPAAEFSTERLSVDPIAEGANLTWIDPAGYQVARSETPADWPADPSSFEFTLDVLASRITGKSYV